MTSKSKKNSFEGKSACNKSVALAVLFALVCSLIMIKLGFWQVERLAWKKKILAEISAEQTVDSRTRFLSFVDIKSATRRDYPYLRGYVRGRFIPARGLVYVSPRTMNGTPGAYLISAFEASNEDGQTYTIAVNLGWVDEEGQRSGLPPALTRQQIINLTGNFRPFPTGNAFTPSIDPEKGRWPIVSPDKLQEYWKTEFLAPLLFYADDLGRFYDTSVEANALRPQDKVRETAPPVSLAGNWRPYNKHAQYALFWFVMAAIPPVVFYLRFAARKK